MAVVFDVLRMSSAMVAAAAAGAAAIWPVATVEAARAVAAAHPGVWLAGERHNHRLPGFTHGNSPLEWGAPIPPGTRVVWTTTNGTRALQQVERAGAVLVGGLVNRRAVAGAIQRWLAAEPLGRVVLVAAGRLGEPSPPDWWGVGAVAAALPRAIADASGQAAADEFAAVAPRLADALRASAEGQHLTTLGYGPDVEWAAALDQVPVLLQRGEGGWLFPSR